ncbi:response regulator [Sulfurimonas sp.]|uniref:response regulator n=1 Tax=Sulfurimonas sp. TaxID=2022749 RepID=UPI00356A4FF2
MKNKDLNILIVEDEVISTQYLIDILESLDFTDIYDATNMDDALDIVKNYNIDIVFMDINIQGSTDGIAGAKLLNKHCFLPIIFTTAYGDSDTISEASDTNAFGYLIKPFEANEVEAALSITLKRVEYSMNKSNYENTAKNDVVDLGMQQKYDFSNKTFYINNIAIDLTTNELEVLYVFSKNLNQNVSYDRLKESVWNNKDISNSTIRDTVSRLKRKTPNLYIDNIINFGYILKR